MAESTTHGVGTNEKTTTKLIRHNSHFSHLNHHDNFKRFHYLYYGRMIHIAVQHRRDNVCDGSAEITHTGTPGFDVFKLACPVQQEAAL